MRRTIIRGGRIIDPSSGFDGQASILIENDRIAKIAKRISAQGKRIPILDASGRIVAPGFVDLHVHLREPGREDQETILSGTRAAVSGGFTSVLCMPNTSPPIDDESVVRFVLRKQEEARFSRVYPVGAITKGLRGEELSEIGHLVRAGAVAVSDDGHSVMNAELMRRALEYSMMFHIPVVSHCEDLNLTAQGVMNEGIHSTLCGMKGVASAAEEVMVARDILLAEYTGAHLHIAHVSTRGSVELIRSGKRRGVRVTCDTTPHYFTLDDSLLRTYDTNLRINPPLRSQADVAAIKAGLADGTIDAVATDHAPHTQEEKEVEFDRAPPGVVGLETALGLVLTELVAPGIMDLPEALARLTSRPSRIAGLPVGTLAVGSPADVTVFDPHHAWTCDPSTFKSKSRNSPFKGRVLKGRVDHVLVDGRLVMKNGRLIPPTA